MQQLDKDEPEDMEAVEVATYDPSKFKKFQPDSLAVDEARRAFLEASSKVIKYQCVFLLFYLAFGNFSYMDMCTVFCTEHVYVYRISIGSVVHIWKTPNGHLDCVIIACS